MRTASRARASRLKRQAPQGEDAFEGQWPLGPTGTTAADVEEICASSLVPVFELESTPPSGLRFDRRSWATEDYRTPVRTGVLDLYIGPDWPDGEWCGAREDW